MRILPLILMITSVLLALYGFVPGTPSLPIWAVALVLGLVGYQRRRAEV